MNKAITDGLQLMPPPFSAGLDVWSRTDGTPGSDTYANWPNAALVPADGDFGGCIELLKSDPVQRVRYMGETPILPGCYLRITARVKAISGNLPSVRIAAWAGGAGQTHLPDLPQTGAEIALTGYGETVEVQAILGIGARPGVDLVWRPDARYAHVGVDLTGPTGGIVRIDDIEVEDITSAFLRDMMDWVDVRDFGAVGDGVTDDTAAFLAADAAADGGTVLISRGNYALSSDVSLDHRARFEGTVTMPPDAILTLSQNFDLPAYIDAFGDEETAFRKAFQALLNNADHDALDLGGRRISVTAPIDMQAAVPNRTTFGQRRVIRNGQLRAEDSGVWDPTITTSQATYAATQPTRLSAVQNIANIPVGALVEGAGVGREVYVRDVNVSAQTLTLSQPLYDAEGTQVYTFTRHKFLMDLSGFASLMDFELSNVEFQCKSRANGVLMAPGGMVMAVRDCVFHKPASRAIVSPGEGCQGMLIDRCNFVSAESAVLAQNRQSIAISAGSNDLKIRNNRSTRFLHFAVTSGSYLLISGNHFFQGDDVANGLRTAGIVLTQPACNTTITGNYIDNCHIEWTNERETTPAYTGGFGFAGLTMTGNVCLSGDAAAWSSFLVVKPYGPGHFVNGLSVTDNTFRAIGSVLERVDRIDDSFADLDRAKMRKIEFAGNMYHNISARTENPLRVRHEQVQADDVWQITTDSQLPFEGQALDVDGVSLRGALRDGGGSRAFETPQSALGQGPSKDQVHLIWPRAVTGAVNLRIRMDY